MTINNHTLYRLCNDNNYFTCGDNSQYEKLFTANENNASKKELALIIWVCSENATIEEIEENLKVEREKDVKYQRI